MHEQHICPTCGSWRLKIEQWQVLTLRETYETPAPKPHIHTKVTCQGCGWYDSRDEDYTRVDVYIH